MATKTISHKHDRKRNQVNWVTTAASTSGYLFEDKDPDMYAVLYLIDQSPYTDWEVAKLSGVSGATIDNWRMGKTKRPQNETLRKVVQAIGIRRVFVNAEGTILDIPNWEG